MISKLFLPLFLLMILVIAGIGWAAVKLPAYLLAREVYAYDDLTTQGTFFLIEQALHQRPVAHWPQVINQLAQQFAYPLRLIRLSDPLFTATDRKTLSDDQLLIKTIDQADIYYRQALNSEYVMAFTFDVSYSEEEHRDAQGSFYLLEHDLLALPPDQWPVRLQTLTTEFGFPLTLQPLNTLPLNARQVAFLRAGKILSLGQEGADDYRFHKLIHDNQVLTAGPIFTPVHNSLALFVIALLAVTVLATALLLFWAYPLWRSMRELIATAGALGQGDMGARSSLSQHSALYPLSHQFNVMAERIQRLINGHRELTHAVSHELRTPMARMRFALDMLEQTPLSDEQPRYVSGLYQDVDELEALVGELLTYARFERNTSIGPMQTVVLIPWLTGVLGQAQAYAGERTLRLECLHCSDRQTLDCCPRDMAKVLHNLLRNACRYARQTVLVSVDVDEGLRLHVEDDGPGIPVADRARIFQAFTRLEDSRNRSTGGYGLGLAIAKRIVEAHRGNLSVAHSPLGGACFTIRFFT